MDDFNVDPTREFFKLGSVCDQVAIDLDLSTSHYFQKFLSWACILVMDLKLDAAADIKTVILPISDVCTCDLPGDFQQWSKVGIKSNQYIKILAVNDDLDSSPRTVDTWNPTFNVPPGFLPNGTSMDQYGAWIFSNHGGRSLVAYGGGLPQVGQFKVVKCADGCKQLLLDAGIQATEIVLEYIGIGISACSETVIDPIMYEYIRTGLHFNWAKFGKRIDKSEAEIQRLGRDLWHQEMKVRGRQDPVTPTDLLRIARKNYRLTAKT